MAYHGLGDITVVIFFGAVATAGLKVVVGGTSSKNTMNSNNVDDSSLIVSLLRRYILTTQQQSMEYSSTTTTNHYEYYDYDTLIAGTQIGLFCCVLLAINNTRDYYSDKQHNKNTLVVQYGLAFGKYEVLGLIASSFGIGWWYWYVLCGKVLPAIMPMAASLSLAFHVIRDIFLLSHDGDIANDEKSEMEAMMKKEMYGKTLAKSALLHLVFSASLASALFVSCSKSCV